MKSIFPKEDETKQKHLDIINWFRSQKRLSDAELKKLKSMLNSLESAAWSWGYNERQYDEND